MENRTLINMFILGLIVAVVGTSIIALNMDNIISDVRDTSTSEEPSEEELPEVDQDVFEDEIPEEEDEHIEEDLELEDVVTPAPVAPSVDTTVGQTTIPTSYRLTSYYPAETSNSTGSGLKTSSFTVNDKGWYLYNGKVVLAAATEELMRSGYNVNNAQVRRSNKYYFKYYEELTIIVDGISYPAIILDSCGACMWVSESRLDLFVSDQSYAIDRGYRGNNTITVQHN